MMMLLGDFNAKLGRDNIFKPIIRNESVHHDSNDNEVRMLKVDEVIGKWRKLYNMELNDLYSSPNIVRVMKFRRMRLAMIVTLVKIYAGFCWGNLRKRDHLGDPGIDGRIIIK